MERLARIGLGFTALVFAGLGVAFLGWPLEMGRSVDVTVTSDVGTVELRAMYGGFELGFAAFLVACMRRRDWLAPGLLVTALTIGSLGATRVASGLALGAFRGAHPILAAVEIGGALLAAFLWTRVRASLRDQSR